MKCDCMRILNLLNAKGVAFEHVDLAFDERGQNLIKHCGNTLVLPQMFVDGKYLGSLDTVQELEDDGALDVILGIF